MPRKKFAVINISLSIFLISGLLYLSRNDNHSKITDSQKNRVTENLSEQKPEETQDLEQEKNDKIGKIVKNIEEKHGKKIKKYAQMHNINPQLVKAIIYVESRGLNNAKSKKGCIGLMQLGPATAKQMEVNNPYNEDENIYGGTKFLRFLMDKFDNNEETVLVAYNFGPTKVEKKIKKGENNFKIYNFVKKVKEAKKIVEEHDQ